MAAKAANFDDLLSIEGMFGAGGGIGADGSAAIVATTVEPGIAGLSRLFGSVSVVVKVTGAGNNSPVVLMFAGNRSGKISIANHIGDVLFQLGVTINGAN